MAQGDTEEVPKTGGLVMAKPPKLRHVWLMSLGSEACGTSGVC